VNTSNLTTWQVIAVKFGKSLLSYLKFYDYYVYAIFKESKRGDGG
jgi:hypothetical protein